MATVAILKAKHDGFMSGGRLIDFERGWALRSWGKVHHLETIGEYYLRAACGRIFPNTMPLMAPGNFPVCKTCESAIARVK